MRDFPLRLVFFMFGLTIGYLIKTQIDTTPASVTILNVQPSEMERLEILGALTDHLEE